MALRGFVLGLTLWGAVTPLNAQETTAPERSVESTPPQTTAPAQRLPASELNRVRLSPIIGHVEATALAILPDVEQQVSVVLQIDGLVDSIHAGLVQTNDAQAVASLLTSTAIIDAALEKSLKLNPKQRQECVVVSAAPAGGRFTRLDVALRKTKEPWQPDAAQQLSTALCKQLKSAYEESARATANKVKADLQDFERHRDVATQKLQTIREQMQKLQFDLKIQYEGSDLQYQLRNLRSQKTSYESELSRLKSRLAAIEPKAESADTEWEKVVALRERRFDELKKQAEAGNAAPEQLSDAELKLAEARAQLATLKRPSVTDATRTYQQNELKQLRVQIAESENRLKPVLETLEKLEQPETRALFASFPELRLQEQNLGRELNELNLRIAQLQRNQRISPRIVITVLDGVADEPQD